MFWSLDSIYTPRALSTWIASIVLNDKQDYLFHSAGHTGTNVSHNTHRKNSGEVLEKDVGDWTGRAEIVQGRNSRQSMKHAWLYSDLLQALKKENHWALGSKQMGLNFCIRCSQLREITVGYSNFCCSFPRSKCPICRALLIPFVCRGHTSALGLILLHISAEKCPPCPVILRHQCG